MLIDIKRVSLLRTALSGSLLFFFVAIILGIFYTIFFSLFINYIIDSITKMAPPEFKVLLPSPPPIGLVAFIFIIVFPITISIGFFVLTLIMLALYNLVAKIVSIRIDLEESEKKEE